MRAAQPYTVRFTAGGRRSLDRLSPRILAAVIEFAFGDLAAAPRRVGKPLRDEFAGHFSAKRGPYRLLYPIDDATLTVTKRTALSCNATGRD